MSSRFLGLDFGHKRMGMAISDPDNILALPRPIISYNSLSDILPSIKNICIKENIDTIIIGLPLNLRGEDSPQTKEIRYFAKLIKETLKQKVILEDERFTSKIIERLRSLEGKKKYRQKKDYDSQAAALILQGFLDRRSAS